MAWQITVDGVLYTAVQWLAIPPAERAKRLPSCSDVEAGRRPAALWRSL